MEAEVWHLKCHLKFYRKPVQQSEQRLTGVLLIRPAKKKVYHHFLR